MTSICPNGHSSAADDYCDVCGAPIAAGQQGFAAPVGVGATAAAPTHPGDPTFSGSVGRVACPHCGTENVAEALFCEACGYDFTTGTLPRSEAQETPPVPGPAVPDAAVPAAAVPDAAVLDGAVPDAAVPDAATAGPGAGAASGPGPFGYVAEVWIDPAWYEAQQSPDPLPSPGLPEIVPLRKDSLLVGRVSRSRNIHPDIDCEPDSGASRRQAQLTTDGTRWWVEDLESANGTFVAGGSDPLPEAPIAVGVKREIQSGDRIYVGAWTRIVVRPATSEEQESLV